MFCTMSPAATDLYVAVTYADGEGTERYAYAMVPTDAPGVVVHDDWDALGMRASGSNSISLEGVELPESGVRGGFRAGDPLPYMERNLVAGLFHAAASLGIAESADAIARRGIAGRINGDARPRMQVADNAVDLAASRGVLSRAAALIDEHRAANPASDGSAEELGALFAEAQAAKAFVNEAAARIVDRALALSGGAGYVNGSPLARAYRDVKAGSFMHPLGANRAYDYLGHVALGEEAVAPLRWRSQLQPTKRCRSASAYPFSVSAASWRSVALHQSMVHSVRPIPSCRVRWEPFGPLLARGSIERRCASARSSRVRIARTISIRPSGTLSEKNSFSIPSSRSSYTVSSSDSSQCRSAAAPASVSSYTVRARPPDGSDRPRTRS